MHRTTVPQIMPLRSHRLSGVGREYRKRRQLQSLRQSQCRPECVSSCSTGAAVLTVDLQQAKKVKHTHNQDNEAPPFPNYIGDPHSPPFYGSGQPGPPNLSQQGQPHPSHLQDFSNHPYADKLYFFDRAKKALESREDYEDFLKLLNLFSKDIIDVQTLVEQARGYLGRLHPELMADFERLVHFDDRDKLERGPPGSIRTGPPEAPSALPVDDGEGPSYRRLLPSVCHPPFI